MKPVRRRTAIATKLLATLTLRGAEGFLAGGKAVAGLNPLV
jgi:hypothetical protein